MYYKPYDQTIRSAVEQELLNVKASLEQEATRVRSDLRAASSSTAEMTETLKVTREECRIFVEQTKAEHGTLSTSIARATEMADVLKQQTQEALKARDDHLRAREEQLQKSQEEIQVLGARMQAQFGQAKEYIDKVQAEVMQEIREKVPEAGNPGGGNGFGLVNPKEVQVTELKDGMTKEEFVHWRDCIDLYLDTVKPWKHHGDVLQFIRARGVVADEGAVLQACRDANAKSGSNNSNILLYNFKDKANELYNLLWPKLSQEYRRMCVKVKDKNWFRGLQAHFGRQGRSLRDVGVGHESRHYQPLSPQMQRPQGDQGARGQHRGDEQGLLPEV